MSPGNTQETISQITCYILPYGGIGILSHVPTYYCIICVGIGVRPTMPWRPTSFKFLNVITAIISPITSFMPAITALARRHKEWQHLLLATWRLLPSRTINITGIRRGLIGNRNKSVAPPLRLVVDSVGIIRGLVGLIFPWSWSRGAASRRAGCRGARFWGSLSGSGSLLRWRCPGRGIRRRIIRGSRRACSMC